MQWENECKSLGRSTKFRSSECGGPQTIFPVRLQKLFRSVRVTKSIVPSAGQVLRLLSGYNGPAVVDRKISRFCFRPESVTGKLFRRHPRGDLGSDLDPYPPVLGPKDRRSVLSIGVPQLTSLTKRGRKAVQARGTSPPVLNARGNSFPRSETSSDAVP